MRRKANDSSGCRVPHVTGVRYRRDSVSIRDYVIGGEYFPDPGNTFFYRKGWLSMVNTGWHHENIVPGILANTSKCPGFLIGNVHTAERDGIYGKTNLPHVSKNSQYCK